MSEVISAVGLYPTLETTVRGARRLDAAELAVFTPESETARFWLRPIKNPTAHCLDPLWHTPESQATVLDDEVYRCITGITTGAASPDATIAHVYRALQGMRGKVHHEKPSGSDISEHDIAVLTTLLDKLLASERSQARARAAKLRAFMPESQIALAGVSGAARQGELPLHHIGVLRSLALVEQRGLSNPPNISIEPLISSPQTNRLGLFPAGLQISRTLYSAAQLRKITRAES